MTVNLKSIGFDFYIAGMAEAVDFTGAEGIYLVQAEMRIQNMADGCPGAIKIAVAAVYETSGINQKFAGPALAGIPDDAA